MKKFVLIYSCGLLLINSCSRNEPIRDPSFRLNIIVNNPAKPFKVSLTICPDPHSEQTGLIHIQRIQENSSVPDYRESGVVRRKILDTVSLERDAFEKFALLIKKTKIWEQQNSIGRRTDGNAYQFTVKDSLREHSFSVMGSSENTNLEELTTFCLDQFELHFPSIPVMGVDSEIDLRKYSRLTNAFDSVWVRMVSFENTLLASYERRPFPLTGNQYIELWQVMENNDIWKLETATKFETKYPVEYRLSVRRGTLTNSFVVYAPSKLADKRYFNVINFIEMLASEYQ
ncbi:hypothetical protein JNM05_13150 [bacterium]|nr:hypothetical protein [bacterium]